VTTTIRKRLASIPGVVVVLVLAVVVFSVGSRDFLTVSNALNILMQGTVLLLVSFGMGLTILSGGVDLSIGAVLGLAGVVQGIIMRAEMGLLAALLAGLALAASIGLINGLFVGRFGLPPFIVTFSTMSMAHGMALVISKEGSVWGIDQRIRWIADGNILSLPVPLVFAIVFSVFFWLLMKYTSYGFGLYALGGNEEAARYSGVPVVAYRTMAYVISGVMAGVASMMLIARMNSALPTAGLGYEWDAIAVAVVGGLIFGTGRGGIPGIVAGAALISVVRNGLNLVGVGIYLQVVVVGLIIVLAYLVEVLYGKRDG
jgi:ribose transport system permease protein